MFRSPISPASFCTLARSSPRSATSSGDSGPVFGILLPGILIPNHQSNAKTAATAMVMRSALKRICLGTSTPNYGEHRSSALRQFPRGARSPLRDFPAEAECTENEKEVRHQNENEKIRPVFKKIRSAQNDRAHERNEVRRREECAERIENPRHRFTRKNKTRERSEERRVGKE